MYLLTRYYGQALNHVILQTTTCGEIMKERQKNWCLSCGVLFEQSMQFGKQNCYILSLSKI